MPLALVAGDGIQQDELGIYLVFVQVKTPDTYIRRKHHGDYSCRAVSFRQVIPAKAGIAAAPWSRELDLDQQPVTGSRGAERP